jgi:ribosomal protein L11 methylase PrmA
VRSHSLPPAGVPLLNSPSNAWAYVDPSTGSYLFQLLSWTPPPTLWSTYNDHSNYTAQANAHKQQIVKEWFELIDTASRLELAWDLGANTGTYSHIAARHAKTVVSFDLDHAAVEHNFQTCRAASEQRILPLVQDLNNSAGIGWRHTERQSLEQRGPADVALARALVHDLAVSGNVPLAGIAAFFRQVCRHLIVEFVPKDDAQVNRMLALRGDVFADYSQPAFEAAFAPHFNVLRTVRIEGTVRTLYLMKANRH